MKRFICKTMDVGLADAHVEGETREGMQFDESRLILAVNVAGRITRFEYFEREALDAALQRFDELSTPSGRGPLALSNASARVAARFPSMFNARDWDAIARVYADDVIFEDRRAGLMTSMRGRDAQVDQMKVMAELGTRDAGRTEPLAIRGERLVLLRGVWSVAGENETVHEIETLLIQEIDSDQRICALIVFGPGSLDAAYEELDARYAAGEGEAVADVIALLAELVSAWNAKDWERMTACVAPDVIFTDRRPAAFEDVRGRDRMIWLAQQTLTPDSRHDVVAIHAISPHLYLNEVHVQGTNVEGGAIEQRYLQLAELRGGCVARTERFSLDQLDIAMSRFDELERHARSARPAAFENAATRFLDRLREAMDRRDMDAFIALHAEEFVHDDRRSGIKHVTRGLDQIREYAQASHELGYGTFRTVETLATRGDRLSLTRRIYRDSRTGPDFEAEQVIVDEVDAEGRVVQAVVFDPDDLDEAFRELDDRYVQQLGPRYADVLGAFRRYVDAYNARDWVLAREQFADDFVLIDHRPASLGTLGPDGLIDAVSQLAGLADLKLSMRAIEDIAPNAGLSLCQFLGRTEDGAPIELLFYFAETTRGSKVTRIELFPIEQHDAAVARFNELAVVRPDVEFENHAARSVQRLVDAFNRRDWGAIEWLFREDYEYDDRRPGMRTVVRGTDAGVENFRQAAENGLQRLMYTPVAVRGERLALGRYRWDASDWDVDVLVVEEYDAEGRCIRGVIFTLDDADAAYAELDERFVVGEGRPFADVIRANERTMAAINSRDWDGYGSNATEDFVFVDHRPASLGTVTMRELVEAHRQLAALIPDLSVRVSRYITLDVDRWVSDVVAVGHTSEGEPLDLSFVNVGHLRGEKVCRSEFFPIARGADAVARFRELEVSAPRELFNEALRTGAAAGEAMDLGDWEEVRQLFANDLVTEDRRAGVHSRGTGVEAWIDDFRTVRDLGFRNVGRPTAVAARGERLALGHGSMADPAGNVIEALVVFETNDERRIQRIVYFDPDDLDAAFQALDHLYAVGEGRPHADIFRLCVGQTNSYNERDWGTFRSRLHDEIPFVDHRAAGAGTLTTPEAQVGYLQALVELAPDVTLRLIEVVRISTDRILARQMVRGSTTDGAEVELAMFVLYEMLDGRFSRMEIFSVDRRTDAIARFDGLVAQRARAGSLANACTRRWERMITAAFTHRDWVTCADLVAEDVDFVDKRSGLGARIQGRASFIDQVKVVAEMGPVVRFDIIATRGERSALMVVEWDDPDAGHAMTVRALHVHELDDELRLAALVVFDPDDLDAALAELDERFIAGDGAPYADELRLGAEQRERLRTQDWDAYREAYVDDVVLRDHRPASLGELRGIDAVVQAPQAYSSLVRDLRAWVVTYHELARDLTLSQINVTGTSREGAEVDLSQVRLQQLRNGRVARIELFPVERLDDARQRFDELWDGGHRGRDSLTNAATRIFEIGADAIRSGDWDAMRAVLVPDVKIEDRRRGIQSRGIGPDAWIDNYRTVVELGLRSWSSDIIAIRGDRLALSYGALVDDDGNVVDATILAEVDASGRATAVLHFDPDDLDDAVRELDSRFAAREGTDAAPIVEFNSRILRSHNDGDWEAFRSMIHDDVVFLDHRPISAGRIESADAWLRYLQTMPEMTSSYRAHIRCYYALAPDRALARQRNHGTSLEGVEFDLELLVVTSMRDGRLASIEFFLPEQLAQARARFEDLADQRSDSADVYELENAASRAAVRSVAFVLADDFTNYVAELATDIFFEDRRALMTHESHGPDALIDQLRSLRSVGTVDIRHDVIAVRGERIALMRTRVVNGEIPGFDVDALSLTELDGEGRTSRVVVFDADDLDVALDELEERFLMAEGAHAEGVVRAAMALRHAWNSQRWDEETLAEVVAGDLEVVDHRQLGAGTLHGRRAWVEYTSALHVAGNVRMSHPVLLALSANAYVVRVRLHGLNDEGGPVDLDHLAFGSARDGWHIDRLEPFALEDAEQALRRFADAMSSDAQTESRTLLENTCTRTWDAMCVTFGEHQWDEHAKRMAPDIVFEDRRPGLQNVVEDLDSCLEVAKTIADIGPVLETKVLAVRGDRLALYHEHYHPATDEPRDVHVELLNVLEVDAKGRVARATNFEVDDVDQAFAELDERFAAGEAGAAADMIRLGLRTFPVWNGQDWDALAALWDPDLVFVDHRQLSPGEVQREELLSMVKSLAELMPDVRHRIVAMPRGDRGIVLTQIVADGTNTEGGRVEFSYLQIACAPHGRYTRIERFELDRYDDAVARYEQLRAAPSRQDRRPENDATSAASRFAEAFRDRDWDRLADTLSDDHVREDRRKGLGNTSGKEDVLSAWKAMAELGYGSTTGVTLAVRGTNLALQRWNVTGDNLFETGALTLFETDADGRCRTMVYFDLDDLNGAVAELDERFAAGSGAHAADHLEAGWRVARAFNQKDWGAYGLSHTDDFVFVDHRPASLGEMRLGELIEATKAMTDLLVEVHSYQSEIVALAPRLSLSRQTITGTTVDGAPLDFSVLILGASRDGLISRVEYFPEDRLDEALARFEELGTVEGDRAIAPLSNAAVVANQRVFDRYAERDWDAIAAAYDDALVSEDRRLGLGSKGGKRGHLAQMQVEIGIRRIDVIPLAIRGDRLSLCRYDFFGRSFDAVLIGLTEVTAEGLIVANVTFDESDLDAAYAELDERFATGFGAAAAAGVRFASRFLRAHNDRDWEIFRSLMRDDVRFIDHRPISLGRIESADDWLRSVKLLCEMSSSYRADIECYPAIDSQRAVVQLRNHGTSLEGVEFEMHLLAVTTLKDDRLASIEFFPIERLDDALATFHELRTDPGRMETFPGSRLDEALARYEELSTQTSGAVENDASRAIRRTLDARARGDWEAFATMLAPDCVVVDERHGLRSVSTGVQQVVGQARAIASLGHVEIACTVVATRGQRLSLDRRLYHGGPGVDMEVETLNVCEIDSSGRFHEAVVFDADALDAAVAELDERFMAGEGRANASELRLFFGLIHAYNDRDWARYRALLHDDFAQIDHRAAGAGRVTGPDDHLRYVQTLLDLSPDVRMSITATVAVARGWALGRQNVIGTTTEGATIELSSLVLGGARDGRVHRFEQFSVDDLDRAIARFEELSADQI